MKDSCYTFYQIINLFSENINQSVYTSLPPNNVSWCNPIYLRMLCQSHQNDVLIRINRITCLETNMHETCMNGIVYDLL